MHVEPAQRTPVLLLEPGVEALQMKEVSARRHSDHLPSAEFADADRALLARFINPLSLYFV